MRLIRLALAQVNPIVGDLEGNTSKVINYIEQAKEWGADLVVFPEMVITGYPPEDLLLKLRFIAKNLEQAHRVAQQTTDICAIYGFVDKKGGDIYNAAAIACQGKMVGVYHKIFLPNYGVFDEARYFSPGKYCPLFISQRVTIGINICEDIWHHSGPWSLQATSGAELILVINASPYHAGKLALREKMLSTRATDYGLFLAYVNMVGGQDEIVFDGASIVFNPWGEIIARGKQFEEDLVLVDLDLDETFRTSLGDLRFRREQGEEMPHKWQIERLEIDIPQKPKPQLPKREVTPLEEVAEVYQALVLGTRDYVYKNGFKKVILGLSGGIDSSLAACIAVDALGPENVLGVSMPSRFSSEGSIKDAQKLCQNLGVKLLVLPIEPAFTAFLDNIFKEPFAGTEFGVAEENIQARIRSNILMSLSNKFGYLVLTTGNKSELATGYVTLGGDLLGGFAILKDVPKTLVYKLAQYKNETAGWEVIPKSIFEKPPSAELRPNQKDSDTLPPYEILDPILRAYVEENRSLQEIVKMGFPEEVVRKVILMVDKSEYKRRQGPVGIKITPRAFGKDWRLPITNRFHDL